MLPPPTRNGYRAQIGPFISELSQLKLDVEKQATVPMNERHATMGTSAPEVQCRQQRKEPVKMEDYAS